MSEHKQQTFREHVINRAFYGGSAMISENEIYVMNVENNKFVKKTLAYGKALDNNIDEVKVNAIDHYYRCINEPAKNGGPVTYIKFNLDKETGVISITNDGPGIPVIKDWPGKTIEGYLPQAIISEERSGSNFNDKADPDRITGGLNGLGIKVTNAGSKKFEVETVDVIRNLYYKQVCCDRMAVVEAPLVVNISSASEMRNNKLTKAKTHAHTTIKWLPDYDNLCKASRFESSRGWYVDNKDTVEHIVKLMAYQTATFISCINYRYNKDRKIEHSKKAGVYFNNQLIRIKDLKAFMNMFNLENTHTITFETNADSPKIQFPWYVGIGLVSELSIDKTKPNLELMSLVNGINVDRGGSHVNIMTKSIITEMNKFTKAPISEAIFNKVFCYFDCKQFPFREIDFDAQTKDKIKIGRTDYHKIEKLYAVSPKDARKIYNLADKQINWLIESKEYKDQVAKSKRTRKAPIRKYDKAEKSGGAESYKCGLFIPEGDSACTTIRNIIKHKDTPINKAYYGTYNIQGVPINALKNVDIIENPDTNQKITKAKMKLQDNIAIQGLMAAIGLEYQCNYKINTNEGDAQFKKLNYGFIVMGTDQDLDGIGHICSLVLVYLMTFWPDLIKRRFFRRFATPIMRVYGGSSVWNFYSQKEYDDWIDSKYKKGLPSGYKTEYYKGLGGHTKEEVLDMGINFNDNIFIITWDDLADKTMNIMYGHDTDGRKQLLSTPVQDTYPDDVWNTQLIDVTTHFKVESKEFQLYNMRRKLKSGIDGMIPTQRKSLCGGRKMFGNTKVSKAKVFQVSGYIAKEMHYSHGDSSMNGVIVKQAQSYVGTNNIPAFVSLSIGFGDRVNGRDANAGPRYIDTKYNAKVMDLIFPKADDWLLEYVFEDGVKCEPKYYVPIIPMAILESETTTGTGWKIDVWARDFDVVIQNIKNLINGVKLIDMECRVWTRSSKMKCKKVNNIETCYGSYTYNKKDNTLIIDELPLRVWSYQYTCYLLGIDARNGLTERKDENGEMKSIPKKPYIKKVKDDTANYVNDIKIQLQPGAYEKIIKEYGNDSSTPIEHFLNLRRFMHQNLNMIDTTNYIREFASYEEVLKNWFPIRKQLYIDRIERSVLLLEYKIKFHENVLRFILMDSEKNKKVNIDKDFSDAERDNILSKNKFIKFNKSVLMNPGYLKSSELYDAIFVINAAYDYISDITIREKSKVSIEKLKNKLEDMKAEYARLQKLSWKSLWIDEIDKLVPVVKEGLKTDWMFGHKKHVFKRAK